MARLYAVYNELKLKALKLKALKELRQKTLERF